jgi:ubiquitin carboxyl-terminal hydrolase 7
MNETPNSSQHKEQFNEFLFKPNIYSTTKNIKVEVDSKYFFDLKNFGNHCYLNSYLQLLYHIPAFRNMIINIPSSNFETKTVVSNLQHIFQGLKSSKSPVSHYSLILSFGWSSEQINSQHDVHEFSGDLEKEISEFGENSCF